MGGTTRNWAKLSEICGFYASHPCQELSTRLYNSKSLGISIVSDSFHKLAHTSLPGLADDDIIDGDNDVSADV